ncbi:MAG: hypothetical protein AAGD25_30085 [Cyanobacteria bacterium P01_F01_bin.150]
MKLTTADADLYFDLMWSLQYYVNHTFEIIPDIETVEDYIALPMAEKANVRDKLFGDAAIIDQFIAENPDNHSESSLAIIKSWKKAKFGKFFLERYLKRYSVFIDRDDEKVYAVLGLYEPLSDIVPKQNLPQILEAILLPFQGKIIYDGMFRSYSLFFGSGIKGSLKEIYMAAKQQGRIIESLDSGAGARSSPASSSKSSAKNSSKSKGKTTKKGADDRKEIRALLERAKKLKGGAGKPSLCSPSFSLVRASLELSERAIANPKDFDELRKLLRKAETNLRKIEKTIDRAEYF